MNRHLLHKKSSKGVTQSDIIKHNVQENMSEMKLTDISSVVQFWRHMENEMDKDEQMTSQKREKITEKLKQDCIELMGTLWNKYKEDTNFV